MDSRVIVCAHVHIMSHATATMMMVMRITAVASFRGKRIYITTENIFAVFSIKNFGRKKFANIEVTTTDRGGEEEEYKTPDQTPRECNFLATAIHWLAGKCVL